MKIYTQISVQKEHSLEEGLICLVDEDVEYAIKKINEILEFCRDLMEATDLYIHSFFLADITSENEDDWHRIFSIDFDDILDLIEEMELNEKF